jgi:transposase-like protein
MVVRETCPQCKSSKYKKNGHIHNGKQNHHCHNCGRQFVQCFAQYLIAEDKRTVNTPHFTRISMWCTKG